MCAYVCVCCYKFTCVFDKIFENLRGYIISSILNVCMVVKKCVYCDDVFQVEIFFCNNNDNGNLLVIKMYILLYFLLILKLDIK